MATQSERREATRAALLDAAVDSLIEGGISGFTTADVAGRAGLSNGALFRHFPTKNDLLAATVEYVFDRLRDDYEEAFRSLDADKRTVGNLLELLWRVMADPALAGVFDVYTAARTDTWAQAAIEPIVTDHMDRLQRLGQSLLGEITDVPEREVSQAVDLAILSMQGLVLNLMARPDPDAPERLIDGLAQLAAILLPSTTTGAD